MARVSFAINHGKGRSRVGAGSELINLFAQSAATGAKDQVYLVGAPGTVVFSELGALDEMVSALQPAFDNKVIAVTSASTYLVDAEGGSVRLGDGLSGRVSIAWNGVVVVAVNGISGIVITDSGVSTITDPDFYPADRVQFIGGYFVFNRKGTGQYFISDLYSTDFDALDFKTAESAPDDTVSLVALRREVWLLGKTSVEVHGITGDTFPFQALAGVSINFGCVAPASALAVDQSVVWLSPDGIVYQSSGYSALRISTHEIEEELTILEAYWDAAFAWSYIEDGHQFYALTINNDTFVYDFSTQLWHKRDSDRFGRHAANCAARAFGKNLIGDDAGRILHMSREYAQDADGDMVAVAGSIPYSGGNGRQFVVSSLEIDCEVGAGGAATLEHSKDDGASWSSRIEASLGAIGEHDRRVVWRRLGSGYEKRFRIRLFGSTNRRMSSSAILEVA